MALTEHSLDILIILLYQWFGPKLQTQYNNNGPKLQLILGVIVQVF